MTVRIMMRRAVITNHIVQAIVLILDIPDIALVTTAHIDLKIVRIITKIQMMMMINTTVQVVIIALIVQGIVYMVDTTMLHVIIVLIHPLIVRIMDLIQTMMMTMTMITMMTMRLFVLTNHIQQIIAVTTDMGMKPATMALTMMKTVRIII